MNDKGVYRDVHIDHRQTDQIKIEDHRHIDRGSKSVQRCNVLIRMYTRMEFRGDGEEDEACERGLRTVNLDKRFDR